MKLDIGGLIQEPEDDMGAWTGKCAREDCSRTKPPVAYGRRYGECYTHEMLGVYFQYEMAGEPDGWHEFDEFETKHEAWLKKLAADGVDLDAFAEAFGNS